jgi:hypothetical protein
MRKTYVVGGTTYEMRTFTLRDVMRVTGKLGVLPINGANSGMPAWQSNELADGLLAICSRKPKITLDEPDVIADGTIPVGEIPDSEYGELIGLLSRDSGFSAEAAEEMRPTSATAEPS